MMQRCQCFIPSWDYFLVYLGVAAGFGKVGNQSELGLRYLLAAFMIILVRGIITEKIARFLTQREAKKTTEA